MRNSITYYRFRTLPKEVRKANGIRSKSRLDCIQYCNQAGKQSGLESLQNHKGMIYLNKIKANEIVNADYRRVADWMLVGRCRQAKCSVNLTSLFNEDYEYPELYYGNPNTAIKLSNGADNPFYPFRHDGYLFKANKDLTDLEMLIIPDQRNMISSWYQMLIDGELDQEIKQLRQNSQTFFDYGYSNL